MPNLDDDKILDDDFVDADAAAAAVVADTFAEFDDGH